MRFVFAFTAFLFSISLTLVMAGDPEPIQIMILGTYHMGHPRLDWHSMKADEVTIPQRRKELDAVASKLAAFNPNKIALERLAPNKNFIDEKYASFSPEMLTTNRDERAQIGFRLAHL